MLRFRVADMSCGGCAKSAAKALQSVDPNTRIETHPATRDVRVESSAADANLVAVLEEAGYPAERRSERAVG